MGLLYQRKWLRDGILCQLQTNSSGHFHKQKATLVGSQVRILEKDAIEDQQALNIIIMTLD